MRYRRFFFLTLTFFLILWTISVYSLSRKEELQQIDTEIAQLQEMKRGYEARALRQENMAEYLQFDSQAVLETRRHLQLAEENRNKAALVQEQIDRLEERKKQLQ